MQKKLMQPLPKPRSLDIKTNLSPIAMNNFRLESMVTSITDHVVIVGGVMIIDTILETSKYFILNMLISKSLIILLYTFQK